MPIFAGLLTGLFSSIADFFVRFLTKKIAFAAAAITTFGIATTALYTALSVALNAVSMTVPDVPGLSIGIWLVITPNAPVIVSTVIAFDATLAIYRWNIQTLRLATFAS